ncbi:MAG TPA: DUF2214 family protein [Gemmatimonadales bacterium]|nr:DUF2214 family protein [Gemmatimonadales bacterium]
MTLRWVLASLHLLALPLGVAAVWARARALRGPLEGAGLRRAFAADALWGLAAVIWILTGAWRAFSGLEKGAAYYLQNPLFHAKLGLLGLILALEIWPMAALIRWRLQHRRGQPVDTSHARTFARISEVQIVLVVLMVLAATAIARGLGT